MSYRIGYVNPLLYRAFTTGSKPLFHLPEFIKIKSPGHCIDKEIKVSLDRTKVPQQKHT